MKPERAAADMEKILEPLVESYPQRIDLARAWAARDKAAIKRVDELLASAGLTMDAVKIQTFCTYLDEFERIARMIASAEARRDAILHEVVQHRGRRGLRRTTQHLRIEGHRG
jgi:enamine deaminase RidA (YjgF/YER057c/UK114 family)